MTGATTHAATIHRTKHLDVADGIEAKTLGNPRLHQFDDAGDGSLWVLHLDEIEVAP